jgi:L-ascorbate metabolism protein UlaG (beta-lactamase superfamily)
MSVRVELIGGPTALIELGGLRILTDPTFDPPGDHASGQRVLVKTAGPSRSPEEVGPVDLVLLSHDQHPDNLDDRGRAFVRDAPLTVSTTAAAERVEGEVRGLGPWTHLTVPRPDGSELRVHAVPAQHGPDGMDASSGPVLGFVLAGDGLPTVYVSGDNASLRVVEEVVENLGPIDIALLFAGAARTARLDAFLTLTADKAARAAALLGGAVIVPVHCEGWAHFTQGQDEVGAAFAAHGLTDRLRMLRPGESAELHESEGHRE